MRTGLLTILECEHLRRLAASYRFHVSQCGRGVQRRYLLIRKTDAGSLAPVAATMDVLRSSWPGEGACELGAAAELGDTKGSRGTGRKGSDSLLLALADAPIPATYFFLHLLLLIPSVSCCSCLFPVTSGIGFCSGWDGGRAWGWAPQGRDEKNLCKRRRFSGGKA